jgi:hypothetical protein
MEYVVRMWNTLSEYRNVVRIKNILSEYRIHCPNIEYVVRMWKTLPVYRIRIRRASTTRHGCGHRMLHAGPSVCRTSWQLPRVTPPAARAHRPANSSSRLVTARHGSSRLVTARHGSSRPAYGSSRPAYGSSRLVFTGPCPRINGGQPGPSHKEAAGRSLHGPRGPV